MDAQAPRSGAPEETAKAAPEARGASLTSLAWAQFRKHPLARLALAVLGVLYLVAAFADFIAPYPETYINSYATFQPPVQIHFRNESGRFVRPYIYAMDKTLNMETFQNEWTVDTSTTYPVSFFANREGIRNRYVPFPVNLIPVQLRQAIGIKPWATRHLFGLEGNAPQNVNLYLWGSDDVGGDIFGKILFGARISLTIGILAAFVSIFIGLAMGGLAGFYGGWVDELILRFVEALSAIPSLFLLIALSAVFYPLNLPTSTVFILVVIVLSVIGWGDVARAVRSRVLSLREQEFSFAAMALGASNSRIIFQHLLPQTVSYIIIYASLAIPSFIIVESVLSFFGLGIQPPATSWGLMLSTAQSFAGVSGLGDRWWVFIPGLFIFISVLAWNLLGDGLRDAFDPRSRD